MKIKLSPNDARSSTRLGDWFAMDIVLDRQQLILCVSEKTRLAVVMKASPYADFPARFPVALEEVLKVVGVSEQCIEEELRGMRDFSLAKASNRSVTGTLNEYRYQLQMKVAHGYGRPLESLVDYSLFLSEIPCLKMNPSWPVEAVNEVFSRPKFVLVH